LIKFLSLISPIKFVSMPLVKLFLRTTILSLVFQVILPAWGQSEVGEPISELQRRILKMEQRALELSQKLGQMSGTEPIQLIDRNESLEPVLESSAQASYDQLPGPYVEPLPVPVEEEPVEPASTVYQSEVNRVVATTQQRKGDYYLMPIWGFAIASDTTFTQDEFDDNLDGNWGNSIGIVTGKRWDNWMLFARVAYQYLEYENGNFQGNGNILTRAHGIEESYNLSFGGGYSIPLLTRISTYGSLGLGFGWRKNSADIEVYIAPQWEPDTNSPNKSYSSAVFTYDFAMGVEYMFSHNYSARLGYRLLGLTSNNSFDSSFQHLVELGVGANF
jgi:opacity protein-like surface antigen